MLCLSGFELYSRWVPLISKRKGQQCLLMSERFLCSCDGFCGASEQGTGAHVTCRLAGGNLERIR